MSEENKESQERVKPHIELTDIAVQVSFLDDLPIYLNKKQIGSNGMCSWDEGIRYLRGVYSNPERFVERFIKPLKSRVEFFIGDVVTKGNEKDFDRYDYTKETIATTGMQILDDMVEDFKNAKPFTYEEAFLIPQKKREFVARVWASIDIREMFSNLPSERVYTHAIKTHQNFYNEDGSIREENVEVTNVYEMHKLETDKIGSAGYNYAIKCWCTTTEEEHWLWVEPKFVEMGEKEAALEAIASTCRVPSNLFNENGELTDNLVAIKRQGDVFLFEFKNKVNAEDLNMNDLKPLNAKQYFGLLKAQA